MFLRIFASAVFLFGASIARSQDAFTPGAVDANGNQTSTPHSAWIDLRQHSTTAQNPQSAPSWVEAVTLVAMPPKDEGAARTVFRIRVTRPRPDLQLLMLRLFFDDKKGQQPTITAWDEVGSSVIRSGALGSGIDLPSSDTVILPMLGISAIDIEVPGDGATVRGALMDWMVSRNVAHPLSAQSRDVMPEPFAAAAPLRVPEQDTETFGTVTATLAPETIRIAASVQHGAAFQFGIESLPLMALITFEVSTPARGLRARGLPEWGKPRPRLHDFARSRRSGIPRRVGATRRRDALLLHRLGAGAEARAGCEPQGRHERSSRDRWARHAGLRDSRHPDSAEVSLGQVGLSSPADAFERRFLTRASRVLSDLRSYGV
jgi:hypothetical protein